MLEHFSEKCFCFFHFYCVAKPTSCLKLRLFYKFVQKRTGFSCLAMTLRSSRLITKSMQTFKELEENMFPFNFNVVGHYFYLRNQLTVTNPKYFNKQPYYKDVKDQLLLDVLSTWTKAVLNKHT